MGQRANALAEEFEATAAEFASTIEQLPDDKWNATVQEGWTVGVLAQHVVGQIYPLEFEFISAAAEGRPLPGYNWEDVNGKNDARAASDGSSTKEMVLKRLDEDGAKIAAYIRALDDSQLDNKGFLPLAGAEVTTEQLLRGGVLIDHFREHLKSIRAAT